MKRINFVLFVLSLIFIVLFTQEIENQNEKRKDFFVTPDETTPCLDTTQCTEADRCTLTCLLDTVYFRINSSTLQIHFKEGTYITGGNYEITAPQLSLFGPEATELKDISVIIKDSDNICEQSKVSIPKGLFTITGFQADYYMENIHFSHMCRPLFHTNSPSSSLEMGVVEIYKSYFSDITAHVGFLTYTDAKQMTLTNVFVENSEKTFLKNMYVDNHDRFLFLDHVIFRNVHDCENVVDVSNEGLFHFYLGDVTFDGNECSNSVLNVYSTNTNLRGLIKKSTFTSNNKKTAAALVRLSSGHDLNITMSSCHFRNNMAESSATAENENHNEMISYHSKSMTVNTEFTFFKKNSASPLILYHSDFDYPTAYMNIMHDNNTFENNKIIASSDVATSFLYLSADVKDGKSHPITVNMKDDTYTNNKILHLETIDNALNAPNFMYVSISKGSTCPMTLNEIGVKFFNNDIMVHYFKNIDGLQYTIDKMDAQKNKQALIEIDSKCRLYNVNILNSGFLDNGEPSRRFIHTRAMVEPGVPQSTLKINNCRFWSAEGGLVFTYNTHLEFIDTMLVNGAGTKVDIGGAILFDADETEDRTTFFFGGKSMIQGASAKDAGGCIYFSALKNTQLIVSKDAELLSCSAKYGGGLFVNSYDGNDVDVDIGNARVFGNTAEVGGGGMYVSKGGLKVKGLGNIQDNHALIGADVLTAPASVFFKEDETSVCNLKNTSGVIEYRCELKSLLFKDEFGVVFNQPAYSEFSTLVKIIPYDFEYEESSVSTTGIQFDFQMDSLMNEGKVTASVSLEEGAAVGFDLIVTNNNPPYIPPGGGNWYEYVIFFLIIFVIIGIIIAIVVAVVLVLMWKKGVFRSRHPKKYKHYEKL